MERRSKNYHKWIVEGYKHFVENGPEKFSVKELSERAGLSRTSFNYYFGTKQDYFDELIEYHLDIVERFVKSFIKTGDYEVLLNQFDEYELELKFHLRLFNNRNKKYFNEMYLRGHDINFRFGVLDWFVKFFEIKNTDPEEQKRIYFFFTDVMYSRFNKVENNSDKNVKFSDAMRETVRDFLLITS